LADSDHTPSARRRRPTFLIEEFYPDALGMVAQYWLRMEVAGQVVTFGTEIPIRTSITLPREWTLLHPDGYELFEAARLAHNAACRHPEDSEIEHWLTIAFAFWRWLPGFDLGGCAHRADAPLKTLGHVITERCGGRWNVNEAANRLIHLSTEQRFFGAQFRYQPPVLTPGEPLTTAPIDEPTTGSPQQRAIWARVKRLTEDERKLLHGIKTKTKCLDWLCAEVEKETGERKGLSHHAIRRALKGFEPAATRKLFVA
jgi:hypothetical protein